MPERTFETPLGQITVTEQDGAITTLGWWAGGRDHTPLLVEAERQVTAFFAGALREFSLPLRPIGGDLQQRVWREMRRIPFGETREYGQIAKALDVAAQPVGQACGQNPIPIIIPCHRIVGAAGLGGFSAPGGVETKVALLRHEGAYSLLI